MEKHYESHAYSMHIDIFVPFVLCNFWLHPTPLKQGGACNTDEAAAWMLATMVTPGYPAQMMISWLRNKSFGWEIWQKMNMQIVWPQYCQRKYWQMMANVCPRLDSRQKCAICTSDSPYYNNTQQIVLDFVPLHAVTIALHSSLVWVQCNCSTDLEECP